MIDNEDRNDIVEATDVGTGIAGQPLAKMMITAEEVAEVLGCGIKKAYKVVADLNKELEAKKFFTYKGRVLRKYFMMRLGVSATF